MQFCPFARSGAGCVAALFLLVSFAYAQVPAVAPGSFAVEMVASGDTDVPDGTITSRFHEGDVRVDVNAGPESFVLLFVSRDGEYVLQALAGGEVAFAATLADLLADDDLYAEFADILLFILAPLSPYHPCVHTPPEDGVLTGDFSVWDCEIVGHETIGGRSTTVWEMEHIWGREHRMAVFNDPKHTVWIDDELGVPIAFSDGFGDFDAAFGSVDLTPQDPGLFTAED